MPLKIVLMGTGDFAFPAFEALIHSALHVVAVVTQPDRTGRGHHHHVNPIKELALRTAIPVWQPENVNLPDSLAALRAFQADLFVVAAYGQLLSAELLSIPPLGAINLHASLLPKYRGAAPVQYAVLNGETKSGVTIFQIEPRLDAGPILGVASIPLGPKVTSGELEEQLARLSVDLTLSVVNHLERGTAQPVLQPAVKAPRAPKIPKSQGEILWEKSSRQIECHVRGMQPWPLAYSFLHLPEKPPLRTIFWDVDPVDEFGLAFMTGKPGSVLASPENSLWLRTGDGAIQVRRLQPAGKRVMEVQDFLCGYPVATGCFFGSEQASAF